MKKILIITYYWPPAGGPGVQRWLKFVKYLRDFDVEPIVYIPENPHYPIVDKSFEKEKPKKIYRIAKPSDITKWEKAISLEKDTLEKAKILVKEHNLEMKLSNVEYQGDNTKGWELVE